MDGAAEASLEATDAATGALVAVYVEGLNAAMRGWRGPLPPGLLELWRRGGLVPLALSRAGTERRAVRKLRLVPARGHDG